MAAAIFAAWMVFVRCRAGAFCQCSLRRRGRRGGDERPRVRHSKLKKKKKKKSEGGATVEIVVYGDDEVT